MMNEPTGGLQSGSTDLITDTNQEARRTAKPPVALSPAARRQRSLAPAKYGGNSRDPRRLFAAATVRSRVAQLFASVPSLSQWRDDDGVERRVPIAHLRSAVRRYVCWDMVYWRMVAQLVDNGNFDSSLLDRALRVANRLDVMEDRLGITRDSRRGETPGIPWGSQ